MLSSLSLAADEPALRLSGKGWFQFGHIAHSSDTLSEEYNYNKNWLQSAGAQLTVQAVIGKHWEGAAGLGGFQIHRGQGNESEARAIRIGFHPYVTQARFSYFVGPPQEPILKANVGLFPFQYNTDATNLGSYLFRGPVYPGTLISEFESLEIDTSVANILGIDIHGKLFDLWKNDLILKSETQFKPLFDLSLACVTSVNIANILEIGAGVNAYRLFAFKKELTDLTDRETLIEQQENEVYQPYDRKYTYVRTYTGAVDANGNPVGALPAGVDTIMTSDRWIVVTDDTTFLSLRGVKLMGRFSFDPKPLIGSSRLGPNDLKLYAEAAVLGVKDYPGVYDNIMERIPIMGGFCIPTFGFFDRCAVEVEWYGAPYRNDYYKLEEYLSPIPTSSRQQYRYYPDTLYLSDGSVEKVVVRAGNDTTDVAWGEPYDAQNMVADNIKWSLYLRKTFRDHIAISFQIANDHYRPSHNLIGGDRRSPARFDEAFTTLKDFYVMMRFGYFF